MIVISRALARQVRAVLRRSVLTDGSRGPWPVVLCQADRSGVLLQACQGDVAVRYGHGAPFGADALAFPGTLLAEIEGRTDTPVTLEAAADGRGRASWTERGVPRVLEFERPALDTVPAFPELPAKLHPQPPEFLLALAEAAASAARASSHFALARLQLRGQSGEVIGTDGKQLLLQSGFRFPWTDELLIPALPVFGAPELGARGPSSLGRTDRHLVLCTGSWTLALAIDTNGRFPQAAHVIPRLATVKARLHFDAEDRRFLAEALPRLAGHEDDLAPVVLELGTPPVVRAWSADGGPVVEVTLARSSASGAPMTFRTDRQYLRRALRLGFAELQLAKPEAPVCCRDRSRCYVWVPLEAKAAHPTDREVVRIRTTDTEARPAPVMAPSADVFPVPVTPTRKTTPMSPTSATNGSHGDKPTSAADAPAPGSLPEIIAETEALRDLLHDAVSRCARLLAALKLQRRQSKAVQQAMASLRQLPLDR